MPAIGKILPSTMLIRRQFSCAPPSKPRAGPEVCLCMQPLVEGHWSCIFGEEALEVPHACALARVRCAGWPLPIHQGKTMLLAVICASNPWTTPSLQVSTHCFWYPPQELTCRFTRQLQRGGRPSQAIGAFCALQTFWCSDSGSHTLQLAWTSLFCC